MEVDCWICKQKTEWLNEKRKLALSQAKQQAIQNDELMAIHKEGCIFKICKASEIPTDSTGIEYVSQYN